MASHAEAHGAHLAHHFENLDQQYQSAKLGMWIFLATEILFFGGLFCAYAVYRANHPEVFLYAHHHLDKDLGAINTVILICSSMTIAWAVRAAQLRQTRILSLMLVLTLLCAGGFLGIKYVEYSHKWQHGLLWASRYHPDSEHGASAAGEDHSKDGSQGSRAADGAESEATAGGAPATSRDAERSSIAPAAEGPAGLATSSDTAPDEVAPEPEKVQVFFSIYFLMTGLHGIHVVGGMGAMVWLLALVRRGAFDTGHFVKVDMVALYWHLVDLIWIYLFLLLYLIH